MKDEHVKDAAQNIAVDVPQDVAQDLVFGARAARALLATPPPPPPPSLCTPPPPRPVINSTTNLHSPHHAACEENTFTNIHVPVIATARATPGT